MASSTGLSKALDKAGAQRGHHPMVPVGMVFHPPPGHPLEHDRTKFGVSPSLRDRIVAEGFRRDRPLRVWQQVAEGGEKTLNGTKLQKGDALFVIGDGCRRSLAAYAAEAILRKEGKLAKGDPLRVPFDLWGPDPTSKLSAEAQFFLMRQEEDVDPEKEHHVPSVIAANFIKATKWGADVKALRLRAPKDYAPPTVTAMLRWGDLQPKAAAAFDAGVVELKLEDGSKKSKSVNINLLSTLIELVPRPEHFTTLCELVAKGLKSYKAASRYINATRKLAGVQAKRTEASAEAAGVESGAKDNADTDGKASEESSPKGKGKRTRASKTSSAGEATSTNGASSATISKSESPLTAEERAAFPMLAEQPSKKIRTDLVAALDELQGSVEDSDDAERIACFKAGLQLSLGEDIAVIHQLPRSALRVVSQVLTESMKRSPTRILTPDAPASAEAVS